MNVIQLFRRKKEKPSAANTGLSHVNQQEDQQVSTNRNSTIDGTNKQASAAAHGWLQLRLDRGRKGAFAEVGELTPEIATILLEMNGENRSFKPHVAAKYARDMLAGRWENNGEAIVISRCGNLNDGQHRCNAVVVSGVTIETAFTFGVSLESRLTTDQGASKTAGDYLGMEGVKNPNNLAAIAGALIDYEAFGKFSTTQANKPTKAEIRERVLLDDGVSAAFDAVKKRHATRIASYTVLGLAFYLFAQRDKDAALLFMERLISGAELKERDPIHVAREKLLDPYKRLNKNEQMKTLIMGWNNWRAGKTVRTLTHTIKKFEKLPEVH